MVETLRDLFLKSVKTAPEQPFLEQSGEILTYEMVYRAVVQRASYLQQADIRPQERLIILNEQPCETVLWALSCLCLGIVFVILPQDISLLRLTRIIEDLDPSGAIDSCPEHKPLYANYPRPCPVLHPQTPGQALGSESLLTTQPIIGTDPAFFLYTSGSMGRPKAVIYPHQAVCFVASAVDSYLTNRPGERIGQLLSLSFVYGLFQVFLAIQAQATLVFLQKTTSPLHLLKQLKEQRISGFPTVRPILAQLARLDPGQMDHLRYITHSGDALPPSILMEILQCFPQIDFFSMFGQSECARALYMPPEKIRAKPGSVGQALPGTRAWILDEQGQRLPAGVVGELVVQGPHIMNGYWRAPKETMAHFVKDPYGQPRLHTGDLFFQDSDGDFYFVGRKDDLLKSKGVRISPREVEELLLTVDPHIKECLVYGVEDALLGQMIYADVIVEPATYTSEEIFARCKASLEAAFVPTRITIVETLSTTSAGKYARRQPVHPG